MSPQLPSSYTVTRERIATGVAGLDPLIGGGLWRGTSTVVAGPTGSGKTTIGLQFALAGIAAGEPALYVNFQENPVQLARAIKSLGSDMTTLRGKGLHLLYTSSVELQIDRVIVQMFGLIRDHDIRRVVVDAIGDLAKASGDIHRTHDYLYALVQQFTVLGITAFLLLEDVSHNPMSGGFPVGNEFLHLSYMCDNLMLLEIERRDALTRRFSIYKTRGSVHDEAVHPVTITAEGVRVG